MEDDEDWLLAINVSEEGLEQERPKLRTNPKKATTCKFAIVGCPFKAVKGTRQMQKHVKRNIERHLSLMCKTVKDQDNQMTEQRKRIEKQDEIIDKLSQTIDDLKGQFEKQITNRNKDEMLLKNLKQDLEKNKENTEKEEQKLAERVGELTEKFDQFFLEHSIEKGLSDMKEYGRYGKHLWTLHNFSRRLQRIQSGKAEDPIRCEPFYTGSPGYKLCIWVYLNGRGKSLGSAISVYGKVMVGEYDSIVQWPIRPQFTFTVFEQNGESPERRDIVRTRCVHKIKKEECLKAGIPRPQTDERSIIVGFDDFVTHEKLQLCGFLKNDNVFLKVEAEILD